MSINKKKGLGRGLTALFGDQQVDIKKVSKPSEGRLKANIPI